MYLDARELPENHSIEADVCIVGAGPAGISIANELAGSDIKVCLLEGGGFDADDDSQSLYEGTVRGLPYTPLTAARVRQFGGTSNHWSGWCRPLSALDFEARSWVPYSGWPFGYRTLEAYYARAQAVFGLRPVGFDPDTWMSGAKGALPLESPDILTTMFRFSAPTRFGSLYRQPLGDAPNVDVYLHANVSLIEPDSACRTIEKLRVQTLSGKRFSATADRYVLATGGIENARLLLASDTVAKDGIGNDNGLVGRFFMDHPGSGSGFILVNDPTQPVDFYTGKARRVSLLAKIDGGSMEQFLEADERRQIMSWAERGSNASEFSSSIQPILERRCISCHNPGGIAFFRSLQKYEEVMQVMPRLGAADGEGNSRQAMAALRLSGPAQARHRVLNYCAVLEESRGWSEVVDGDGFWKSVGNVASNFGVLAGASYRKLFDEESRRALLRIVNIIEPSPNPASRVTLNRDRDRLGMRRVTLEWRLNAEDGQTIAKAQEVLGNAFGHAGIGRLLRQFEYADGDWRDDVTHGWHHMGTTRMNEDPRQGVVDADCRVHGIENLYVAGSSVFPTYGFSQPTFTIVALALRLADHIRRVRT